MGRKRHAVQEEFHERGTDEDLDPPQVGEPLVVDGAHESLSPDPGQSAPLRPSGAGLDTSGCHVTVENVSKEIVWLNYSGVEGEGWKIKPGKSVERPYVSVVDGLLSVTTTSSADGASDVKCTYEGF